MSNVTVCLLTYNRFEYAERTLTHVLVKLQSKSGEHEIDVHIADDGSPDGYVDKLVGLARSYTRGLITTSNSLRGGYGRNLNLALQTIHQRSSVVLPLEDDWELTRELDIDPLVAALEDDPRVGCIRLGYLGFTDRLQGDVIHTNNRRIWLALDPNSQEKHVFAGHPRLESRGWERYVGPWPEGLSPGETELAVCAREESRRGVMWPMDLIWPGHDDLFAHIGTVRSY